MRMDKATSAEERSPYERLRRHGAIRSALIAYGIGAFVYFFPRPHPSVEAEPGLTAPIVTPATSVLQMLLIGLAMQMVAFALRKIVTRYERAHGVEGFLSPLALFIFELVADGVTVLLFAVATLRGIASFGGEL